MQRRTRQPRLRFTDDDAQHHVLHACWLSAVFAFLLAPIVMFTAAVVSGDLIDWMAFGCCVCAWSYFVFRFDMRAVAGPSTPNERFLRAARCNYSRVNHFIRCGVYGLIYVLAFVSMLGMLLSTRPYHHFALRRRRMFVTIDALLEVLVAARAIPRFERRYFTWLFDCAGAWIAQHLACRGRRLLSLVALCMVWLVEAVKEETRPSSRLISELSSVLPANAQHRAGPPRINAASVLAGSSDCHSGPNRLLAYFAVATRSQYLPALSERYSPRELALSA